jgi:hypothetical protein
VGGSGGLTVPDTLEPPHLAGNFPDVPVAQVSLCSTSHVANPILYQHLEAVPIRELGEQNPPPHSLF